MKTLKFDFAVPTKKEDFEGLGENVRKEVGSWLLKAANKMLEGNDVKIARLEKKIAKLKKA